METSALIVESEPATRDMVGKWLTKTRSLELRWQTSSLGQARALLQHATPDVVFCATELDDGEGFDVLCWLDPSTRVVLLANSPAYAARAFDVEACDYLVKPLSAERFEQAVRRVTGAVSTRPAASARPCSSNLLVHDGAGQTTIDLRELMAVVSVGGNYTELLLSSGASLDARRPIKDWERDLPREAFVRTHRSAIVNLAHVERIYRRSASQVSLRLRASALELPVSRRLARHVRAALQTTMGWAA
ncbi:MAG: response regulator transcription factor [Polyangiaceae bacterium]|nr:response regulator transcription factor [Polyangiaceae bacterium]